MNARQDVVDAIEGNDPAKLLRIIDGMCSAREWDDLVDLAARCRQAVERGRQLWGVAYHADYRLALEGPPAPASAVAISGGGGFTLGPLTEVAASSHTWRELDPHLPNVTARTLIAYERVVRGEDLRGTTGLEPRLLDLPLALLEWEPKYATAAYRSDRANHPTPPVPPLASVALPPAVPALNHPDETDALLALTETWVIESNGRSEAAAVEGTAIEAVAALGPRQILMGETDLGNALAWMAWAAASGGAHGKRPGAAAGRFAAWWALAALTDLLEPWPPDPEELGEAGSTLRWYIWDDLAPSTGWVLRLAAEDPHHGLAWAVSAMDAD
ncbi:MAG TPA: hypothetical protein VLT15_06860 [Acidimicrobiia bacterium]|nr:hypothetical protein [Acidimicrobiia bacterium]